MVIFQVRGARGGSFLSVARAVDWEGRFDRFLEPFLDAWKFKKRRAWAPVYVRGLLLPGERKSIEPLAARVAPGHDQELRHFVSESAWDAAPIEAVLWEKADRLLGGDEAYLVIDDTALPKKGDASVGVAPQYCGALGKKANCQSLVSVTLARGDIPLPLSLRLYLPEAWASDGARRAKVGVPESVVFEEKWRIALREVRRVREAGVRFTTVLADAGYGACRGFRDGLTEMGLLWAVGVMSSQRAYPAHVTTYMPPKGTAGQGPRKHPLPTEPDANVSAFIDALGTRGFRTVTWRNGTKGPLRAKFAACRVKLPDPSRRTGHKALPSDEVWLVAEQRSANERKYYVTNHPEGTSLRTLAAAIKARWSCEQVHQQLKEELGLDHFEGRSWMGLHHHALLTMVAFAFLQHERVRENKSAA
ncbi:MAG: IS701 family transposase [Proteobacteria bacterium]|nr:MAG: IS701 family transposase [Pseudomonadota bacterium]